MSREANRSCVRAVAIATLLLMAGAAVPASAAQPSRHIGHATVTFYWTVDESDGNYRGARTALRDAAGRVLAMTTTGFRKALVREGSGVLRDGRSIIYDRKLRGEHRFRICRSRYGLGVTGFALVPYRSAAVDPRFIRLGSRLFVPQLKGALLPDGTVHDGYVVATDRGQFRGRRVDIFVGSGERSAKPLVRNGCRSRSKVALYTVAHRPETVRTAMLLE